MTSIVFSHTKLCTKCNIEKSINEFSKDKSKKDGLHSNCKLCRNVTLTNYYNSNREYYSERNKLWHEVNKPRHAQQNRIWRETHKPIKLASKAKRRSAKLQATPLWCEVEQIKDLYERCSLLSQQTGIKHHVDHIVPLQSGLVCGLHCLANLQIITASDNLSKGNYLWPDMP